MICVCGGYMIYGRFMIRVYEGWQAFLYNGLGFHTYQRHLNMLMYSIR
jgi:hypothetical protein